ncbi:MAG: methyltransferase domain-containing protein [Kiritimatiellae bacterium]|nr:methyltransferase domain-containing protein [Kiritimatiellia bacterium]
MTFEFDGKRYEAASAHHQKEWGARLIAEFAFRGDEHILDLGCGDGALTARLAQLVPRGRVVGLDASHGMIEQARTRGAANIEFRIGDINALSFDGELDLVFSNATLHWIKDHRRLLAAVHRALKPGGMLRFNFAANGNCPNFMRVVRDAMAGGDYAESFRDFEWPWYMPTIAEYEALLAGVRFSASRAWPEDVLKPFPSADAMTAWLDQPSLVPFLAHLPQQVRQAFRDTVVERMLQATRRPDGTCLEPFRRINVHARK